MSIAVSVIVRPSPGLRLLHACFCGGVLASAAACPGQAAPLLCAVAATAGWWRGRMRRNRLRFDISGVGQMRLTVYQNTGQDAGAARRVDTARQADAAVDAASRPGAALRLLDGSTIWPCLLLLRLEAVGGAGEAGEAGGDGARHLVVLPDSVARADWRALALACRAVATGLK